MKEICYYHKVDLDGKCSAAIVKRKYPECELIGVDYPDRPDFDDIKPNDTVIIVDYSFKIEAMTKLTEICGVDNVIWIDHHKSAITHIAACPLVEHNGFSLNTILPGKREIGKAACELTWEYLFPDEPMPNAVRLLGLYDVWDHSDENVLAFQFGMRLDQWDPDKTGAWHPLLEHDDYTEMIIEYGKNILLYEKQQNAVYAEAMAFSVEFEGHDAWAINKALSNSKIFETIENSHARPLWILFSYRDGIWKYSLYSAPDSDIDVSKIAVKHGGGGHAGAAGFQSEKYLLKEISS